MKRLAWMLLLPLMGCTVTAGVYVEKDWRTEEAIYASPDLRTKAKMEIVHECKDTKK